MSTSQWIKCQYLDKQIEFHFLLSRSHKYSSALRFLIFFNCWCIWRCRSFLPLNLDVMLFNIAVDFLSLFSQLLLQSFNQFGELISIAGQGRLNLAHASLNEDSSNQAKALSISFNLFQSINYQPRNQSPFENTFCCKAEDRYLRFYLCSLRSICNSESLLASDLCSVRRVCKPLATFSGTDWIFELIFSK